VLNKEIDRRLRHQTQSKPKFVNEPPVNSSGKNGDIVYFRNNNTVEQYLKEEGEWIHIQTGSNLEPSGPVRPTTFNPFAVSTGGTGGGGTGGGSGGGGGLDPDDIILKPVSSKLSTGQYTDRFLEADMKITDGSLGVNVQPSATNGRIDAGNDVVAYSTSDERLKENIKPLENALDKINQINGVEFDWIELNDKEKKVIHGNEGHDIGVIAQEIEKVLPEVVTERDSGYKAVKYEKLVPLLIEAVKELSNRIK